MPQTFACPNCGASLAFPDEGVTGVVCPFCSTSVIVPQELSATLHEPTSVTLTGHTDFVCGVAWSPDSKWLVSASYDHSLILWTAATGKLAATLNGHTDAVGSVAWSPNGKQLASGSHDMTVIVWDMANGKVERTLRGHTGWVRSVAWSPDSHWLASGSQDGSVRMWDATNGQARVSLIGHPNKSFLGMSIDPAEVYSVAWSPDGRQLATGVGDHTVTLWDVASGAQLTPIKGHTDWVVAVAWSPDGKRLASASADKTIIVWDVSAGHPLTVLTGNAASVCGLEPGWAASGIRGC